MSKLELLRAAVAAKIAYWNANRALELALGFDDVPDGVDEHIENTISSLAAARDDVSWIDEVELAELVDPLGEIEWIS